MKKKGRNQSFYNLLQSQAATLDKQLKMNVFFSVDLLCMYLFAIAEGKPRKNRA